MNEIMNEVREFLMPTKKTVQSLFYAVLDDIRWAGEFPDRYKILDLIEFVELRPPTLCRQ